MIHRYTQREALDGENLGYKGTSTERKMKRGEEIFKVFLSHRIDIFEMYVESERILFALSSYFSFRGNNFKPNFKNPPLK